MGYPLFRLLHCLLMVHASSLYAQDVQVLDALNKDPLEYVTLHHASGIMVTTNAEGIADLTPFSQIDSVHFRLVGYRPLTLSLQEIAALEYRIVLVPQPFTLGEFTVSAHRWEQDGQRVPKQVTVLHSRDVAFTNPGTAADLLQRSGEIFVQRSQLGGGSPMLRGFSANRVLIVVDGVRMNNAIYRGGNLQNVIGVDANAIERAEVLHGPGAMTYGSDAIGGVMDFHLLSPRFSTDSTMLVQGGAMARYASAPNERSGNVHVRLGGKKLAFVGSASASRFGDLRMGSHGPDDFLRPWYVQRINGTDSMVLNPDPELQVGSAFDQRMFIAKLAYKPVEPLEIGLNFYHSTTSDIPRYDRLIELRANGDPRSAEWYYGPQEWTMKSVHVRHSRSHGIYDKARLVVAHQDYGESRHDRNFQSATRRSQTERVSGIWATLDLNKEISERLQLLYGGEFVQNMVSSSGSLSDIGTAVDQPINSRYPDGSEWRTASIYGGAIFDVTEKLTLSGGIRYNAAQLHCDFDTTLFPYPIAEADLISSAVTGNLGAAHRPGKDWKFALDLSTGFRAPNIDDIGKVFESEPGAVVVPNPRLVPEYAYSAEMALEKVIRSRAHIRGGIYTTLLDKAMVRRPFELNGRDSIVFAGEPSRVDAMVNSSQAWVVGSYIAAEVVLCEDLKVDLRYNWQRGMEQDDELGHDVPLRHAPPPFGQAGLAWERKDLRIHAQVVFSDGFSYEQLPPTEQAKPALYAKDDQGRPHSPSWFSMDLRSSYRINASFLLTFGIVNITDQRYRPYSSGITAPGRNLVLAMRYTLI